MAVWKKASSSATHSIRGPLRNRWPPGPVVDDIGDSAMLAVGDAAKIWQPVARVDGHLRRGLGDDACSVHNPDFAASAAAESERVRPADIASVCAWPAGIRFLTLVVSCSQKV